MVKHPKYQAQDRGRQEEIPRAFERHCGSEYEIEVVKPHLPKVPIPGPIPRPTFKIMDKSGKLVAHFHPYGHSECLDDDFRLLYNKMVEDVERAGLVAMERFEKEFPDR